MLPSLIAGIVFAGLAPAAEGAMQGQRSARRFGPGVCGPIDPTYLRGATETGGQLLILAPDEIAKSSAAMDVSSRNELILWASGEGERTYTIPVDASVRRVAFFASFDETGGTLVVTAPDGTPPSAGTGVQDVALHCGRIVSVDAPAAGAWQLRVQPTGRFWLAARAVSDLSLEAEFVRPGGRPEHEGLFRIHGQPVAGRAAMLRVRLEPTSWGASFGLVSLDGRPLHDVHLAAVDDEEFVGTIALPAEPFRVVVRGFDEHGRPSQRMSSRLFRPEPIEVVPVPAPPVAPGGAARLTFIIRNTGAAAVRLNLTALDTSQGRVVSVEPAAIDLGPGEEGSAGVPLAVPASATDWSSVAVMLAAYTDGSAPVGNSATGEITVTTEPR